MTPSLIQAVFAQERDQLAGSFPRVWKARLIIVDRECSIGGRCGVRDLGWADSRDVTVSLLKRVLTLPMDKIVGLIRHELGHLADPYISQPGAEQRADDIAEMVSGERIRYDRNDIQTVGHGKYPRPLYLHR
jgi:hypothetical protein